MHADLEGLSIIIIYLTNYVVGESIPETWNAEWVKVLPVDWILESGSVNVSLGIYYGLFIILYMFYVDFT